MAALVCQAMLLPGIAFGQVNDIYHRIYEEGTKNSQVMKTAQVLTDVYSPRLTGSPKLRESGQWALKQMTSWGFENAAAESWDWGRPGWSTERSYGFITGPVHDSLVFEVLAWTPSTNGVVKGSAFHMMLPERPTQDELTSYLNGIRNRVKGNIVFYGPHTFVPVNMNEPAKRSNADDVKNRVNPYYQAPAGMGGFRGPGGPGQGGPQAQPTPRPNALSPAEVNSQVNQFMVDAGVGVRVNDAGRPHGQIRAFSNNTYDVTKAVPTVVMRNEDFGRVVRLLGSGHDVQMEFDIKNHTHPEGRTEYNYVAEIVGTDKKDEVIILGGHLDAWHSATGAADNASGVSTMMEAARILKALGVKPRRTIRVALWTGEEQGLHGSQAYVAKHFGTAENPKPAWYKFGGYFNHDTGTGRIRSMTVFGPEEAAWILREAVGPFSFLGIEGVSATNSRRLGGSDHTSFNVAGLPGIGLGLDPIEYGSHTWHTNLDTYERLIEADLQQGAIVTAAAVYRLAMRDELLPRFAKDKMPAPPPSN